MRTRFLGYGAYVSRITSATRCELWTVDPVDIDFAADATIAVDLAKRTSVAAIGRIAWSEVEVDDHVNSGGLTRIGPLWPEGATVGAIYLADAFVTRLGLTAPPPIDGRPYELETVVYHPGTGDLRAGRRYLGFHAHVLARRGRHAQVQVYPGGSSRTLRPLAPRWLDLGSPSVCDAGPGSMSTVAAVDDGALFLEASLAAAWPSQPVPRRGSRELARRDLAMVVGGASGTAAIDLPKLPPTLGACG